MISKVQQVPGLFDILADTFGMQTDPNTNERIITCTLSVDTTLCMRNDVVSLSAEIVTPSQEQVQRIGSAADFNRRADQKTRQKFAVATSERTLAQTQVDVSKLVSNFDAKSLSQMGAIERTRQVVRSGENDAVVVGRSLTRPSELREIAQGRDPASQRAGFLPNDGLAAFSSTSTGGRPVLSSSPDKQTPARIVRVNDNVRQTQLTLRVLGTGPTDGLRLRVRAFGSAGILFTQEAQLNLAQFEINARVPLIPPVVSASFSDLATLNLTVTQRDPNADSVAVITRETKDFRQPVDGFTRTLYRFPCRPGQTSMFRVTGISSSVLLRAFAQKGDTASSEFSGSVARIPSSVGKMRSRPVPITVLVCTNTLEGVGFYVSDITRQAAAVMIKRRDLRNNEDVWVTKAPIPLTSVTTLIDETATDLAEYEYTAAVYTSTGDVRYDDSTFRIKRFKPRQIVSVSIDATPKVEENQTVEIKITSSIKPNDVNFLIDFMTATGLDLPFQADLTTLKNSLLNCVKFDVFRVDLQSGNTKYVGQTNDSIVDDIDDVRVRSRIYYYCVAFVRSPSQLTNVIADRANRTLSTNPDLTRIGLHITKADIEQASLSISRRTLSRDRKFFSRENFETGTMPSAPSRDAFLDGETGDTAFFVTEVVPSPPTVSRVTAQNRQGGPIVSWIVNGDTSLVDRYEVEATSSGARWTVTAAGHATNSQRCVIQDRTRYDAGRQLRYLVTPVYLDGTKGATSTSTTYTVLGAVNGA